MITDPRRGNDVFFLFFFLFLLAMAVACLHGCQGGHLTGWHGNLFPNSNPHATTESTTATDEQDPGDGDEDSDGYDCDCPLRHNPHANHGHHYGWCKSLKPHVHHCAE